MRMAKINGPKMLSGKNTLPYTYCIGKANIGIEQRYSKLSKLSTLYSKSTYLVYLNIEKV